MAEAGAVGAQPETKETYVYDPEDLSCGGRNRWFFDWSWCGMGEELLYLKIHL